MRLVPLPAPRSAPRTCLVLIFQTTPTSLPPGPSSSPATRFPSAGFPRPLRLPPAPPSSTPPGSTRSPRQQPPRSPPPASSPYPTVLPSSVPPAPSSPCRLPKATSSWAMMLAWHKRLPPCSSVPPAFLGLVPPLPSPAFRYTQTPPTHTTARSFSSLPQALRPRRPSSPFQTQASSRLRAHFRSPPAARVSPPLPVTVSCIQTMTGRPLHKSPPPLSMAPSARLGMSSPQVAAASCGPRPPPVPRSPEAPTSAMALTPPEAAAPLPGPRPSMAPRT